MLKTFSAAMYSGNDDLIGMLLPKGIKSTLKGITLKIERKSKV